MSDPHWQEIVSPFWNIFQKANVFFLYIGSLSLIKTYHLPEKDFFASRSHQLVVKRQLLGHRQASFSRPFRLHAACAISFFGSGTKLWLGFLSFQGNKPILSFPAPRGISSVRRFFQARISGDHWTLVECVFAYRLRLFRCRLCDSGPLLKTWRNSENKRSKFS